MSTITEPSIASYTQGQVYEVDPSTLTIGTNVRADVRESGEFAASIKARGVLELVTVWVDNQGHLVVYRGQRRALTASKVGTPTGTIPVRVVARPGDADRITDQLSENVHREAMHAGEQRDAIEQLSLLGVSAAQIAKRTALRRGTVNAALSVATSQVARERMDRGGLTLEQAAALAEFDANPDAVAEIEQSIGWGQAIDHTVQRLRDKRAEDEQRHGEVQRLREQGLPVLDVAETPRDLYALRLDRLVRAEDGHPVPEDQWPHVTGSAVVVDTQWQWATHGPATDLREGTEPETTGLEHRADDQADEVDRDEAEDKGDREDGESEQVQVLVAVWICTDPEAAGLCLPHQRATARTPPPRPATMRPLRKRSGSNAATSWRTTGLGAQRRWCAAIGSNSSWAVRAHPRVRKS